ncbi:MAG TPA: TetR/AcrR family transcriptional regulator [Candidatus Limnocylindrales bacterium]|jgi:AcrR family transcriptional regulator
MGEQKKPAGPRPYRMGRRREQLDATRRRIAEAAFELHATVGPAQTSVSAVAERAGVQRHTVYHHFPDLGSLFRACTEHGMQVTRTPEAAPWRAIEDPTVRLREALSELYAYYRANARLLGNIVRDAQLMADVGGSEAFVDRMTELFFALAGGWTGDAATQRLQMAAIGHAMAYETWRSLSEKGLSDEEAGDLMVRLVTTAGSGGPG